MILADELKYWDPPHNGEEISGQKRAQIVRMLETWLVSTGETVRIDWGSKS